MMLWARYHIVGGEETFTKNLAHLRARYVSRMTIYRVNHFSDKANDFEEAQRCGRKIRWEGKDKQNAGPINPRN